MAEDRYLLFPQLAIERSRNPPVGSWIRPDQMLSGICKKPEFLLSYGRYLLGS